MSRTTRLSEVGEVGQRGHRLSAQRRTNPVLLETVLGAEEAVLDPQLQACRALERPSIVVAVDAEALALGGRLIGHGGRWARVSVAKVVGGLEQTRIPGIRCCGFGAARTRTVNKPKSHRSSRRRKYRFRQVATPFFVSLPTDSQSLNPPSENVSGLSGRESEHARGQGLQLNPPARAFVLTRGP